MNENSPEFAGMIALFLTYRRERMSRVIRSGGSFYMDVVRYSSKVVAPVSKTSWRNYISS
jgi:hypothetical protein